MNLERFLLHGSLLALWLLLPSGRAQSGDVSLAAATGIIVTTKSLPAAGGTTSGGGTYTNGESVTVTASPDGCYDFSKWTVGAKAVSTDASYTFTVGAGEVLVANFTLKEDAITTASNPPKGGTTTGKGTYGCGKPVTVRATA